MLENVQQVTIKLVILSLIEFGSLVFTDEYNIYDRLEEWGFEHKTANHSLTQWCDFLG
jgi:transposase-like protein